MFQRVTHDSHFDQHEAKPRFCEEALSYRVMQSLEQQIQDRRKSGTARAEDQIRGIGRHAEVN